MFGKFSKFVNFQKTSQVTINHKSHKHVHTIFYLFLYILNITVAVSIATLIMYSIIVTDQSEM